MLDSYNNEFYTYIVQYYDKEMTQKASETWKYKNKNHREDGPAIIIYNQDGSIDTEIYIINDLMHNTSGPASITYLQSSSEVHHQSYWLNGVYYTEEEWLQKRQEIK